MDVITLDQRKNEWIQKIGVILVLAYAFVLIVMACIGPVYYAEIDTNALPVISLQYRGSLTINQSDIDQAKLDFPSLYASINSYDDLRSSKLIILEDNKWFPYYFPIYPLLCIPLKILLAFLNLNQEKTFYLTNALLVSGALLFLQLKLKVSPLQKIAAVLMLAISPSFYYNNYINYEAFIYAMLIVAMVLYYNGHRNWSAFFVSLGAMPNSTVAAIGLVMIADYGIKILWKTRRQSIVLTIQQYWKETLQYALCFIPCLIPFAVQRYYLGRTTFAGSASQGYLPERVLSYLFDPSLGFVSFAPVALLFFFLVAIVQIIRKRYEVITWLGMLLAVIYAYSLMPHINCGMLYCARYVVWSYAIIPIYLVIYGYRCIDKKIIAHGICAVSILSTLGLMMWNGNTPPYYHSNFAQALLQYLPAIYNPYSATFYCRTLHVDGAYEYTQLAYYEDPVTDQICKMIYKADPGQADVVLSEVKGDAASMEYLEEKLDQIGTDGKFHYLNFPVWGTYKLYEKTPVEKGELIETGVQFEVQNIELQNWGDVNGYSMPIQIKPNTNYQIELTLPDHFDISLYPTFFVDFYGGGDYDRGEQEKMNFLVNGRSNYVFYFNSGPFEGDFMDAYARIVTNMGEPAEISYFCVTELEQPLSPAA